MKPTPALVDLLAKHVASLLCGDPPVLAVYDSDFAANRAVFAAFAREHPRAAVLVQLGWQHETDEAAGRLAEAVAAFRADVPASVRVVALANCPREREQLAARGVEARFVHQNAFLDERRYRPLRAEKRYDAVYLARLTPFKRHVLVPPALGGRAELYPEEFVASVDAAEDAVGAAVERWRAAPPDPWRVRAAFLARVEPHRAAWRELMRELAGRAPGRPPHKLGIRTPHPGRAHTFAIALLNRLAAFAPR